MLLFLYFWTTINRNSMLLNLIRSRLFLIGVVLIGIGCNNVEHDPRPNILLLFADDMGYGDLGSTGSPDVKTPHIDALKHHGLSFTQAYVSAPQCSPSRAGLMTGKYQQRFGHEANAELPFVQTFGLDTGQKTFARFMKDEGYRTLGFGKWDLGSIPSATPWTRGFDHFFGHYAGARSFYVEPDEPRYQALRKSDNDKGGYQGYLTNLITQDAIEQMERSVGGKPWFAFMSYLNPHWPMEPTPEDLKAFSHIPDRHRRIFLALMKNMDDSVGDLVAHLKETGQYDNTVIIFLSDNGGPTGKPRPHPNAKMTYGKNTSVNDPFRGVKGEVFEGGIRTPMYLQWPAKIPKSIYSRPVISLDLLPTCLAIAGGVPDRKLDGVNLIPFITGEVKSDPHDDLYWRWFRNWAIRRGQWKLVAVDHDERYLFNIANDKEETIDRKHEYPTVYRNLMTSLKQWDDQLQPAKWRYPEQTQVLSIALE